MTLSTGTQLGPYEILSPLGAGGMGEVYLARDSKLDRRVAIKVLPETMTRDAERVARFDRRVPWVSVSLPVHFPSQEQHGQTSLPMPPIAPGTRRPRGPCHPTMSRESS